VCKRVRAYATVLAAFSPPNYRTGRCKIPNPNWRCKLRLPLRVSRRSLGAPGTLGGRTNPPPPDRAQKIRARTAACGLILRAARTHRRARPTPRLDAAAAAPL
jgi:hypothetical protein